MRRAGFVASANIPGPGAGQKPLAYYLRRRAGEVVPDVLEVSRSNSLFRGLGPSPWHALAIGELGTYLEAHAAEHPHVELLERLRDRQWVISFDDPTLTKLLPDSTVLIRSRGRLRILFIEMLNQPSVIIPGSRSTRPRSLMAKLAKYRAFNPNRKAHPLWQTLERAYGDIGGFQVLLVTVHDATAERVLLAAEGSNTMFLVGSMPELRGSTNLLSDPVWHLPRSPWRPDGPQHTRLIDH